ncbi:MAG: diaminopimelate epimerase [Candidatus Cloacimonetes bacterium]|nr:diaminopimelate epimerase [Candidatus Cloacimonadota bacterium]
MNVKAIKMHGQGNDYIFLDLEDNHIQLSSINQLAIKLSDRHFGIGGDGLILIEKMPQKAIYYNARLKIYNSDGSEANTCGTALRCAAYYLYEKHSKTKINLHTLSGVKRCNIDQNSNRISVNMGKVIYEKAMTILVDGIKIKGYSVNIGNPHFVVFDIEQSLAQHFSHQNSDVAEIRDVLNIGMNTFSLKEAPKDFMKMIENHHAFPNKTNIMIITNCEVGDINIEHPPLLRGADKGLSSLNIKIWERGSGFTLACGSGACASAFMAFKLLKLSNNIKVFLPGGEVMVKILDDETCELSGNVNKVFETELKPELLNPT